MSNKPDPPYGRSLAAAQTWFTRLMQELDQLLFRSQGIPANLLEDDREAPPEPGPINEQELDDDAPTVIETEIREARAMYRDSEGRARFVTIRTPITADATPQQNACHGCEWYCGETHRGHLLVCGMYPMGPTQNPCPDWQAKARKGPDNPFGWRGL